MNDERKSKAKLILELKTLRRQVKRCQVAERRAARTAEALRESEAKYRLLFENSIDAVLLTSPDGGILDANRAACRMFGRTVRELRQLGRRAVVDLSDPRLAQAIEGHKRMGKFKGELTFLRKDGSKFPGEISSAVFKDKDGNPRTSMSILDITERKRAEENLRQSEDRYRDLVEHSQDLICTHDLEGRLLTVNSTAVKMLGYSLDEIAKMKMRDFLAPKVRQLFDRYLTRISRDHFAKGQLIVQTKSGERRIWEYDNTLRTEGVTKPFVRGWARDITERKLAEQANKRAEQLQHAVYRIAQAAAESAGLDDLFTSVHKIIGTVVEAKNFYIALYDEAKEFVHFPYFVDEKDAPPPPRKTRKGLTEYVLRTGKPLICDEATKAELHRNGDVESIGTHPAVWLGVPLIVGKKTSGVMAVQHYSDPNAYGKQDLQMLEYVSSQVAKAIEQKQAEEALRESEERFRRLYQQAPLGYQSLDAEGCFIDVNQAWLDLLGYSRDQVIGHWFGDFLAPQEVDAFKQRFQCFKATGEVHVDLEMVQRAGSKIIVYIDGKIGHDEHGQFKQTHCILHDITERKRAEEALRESEEKHRMLFETMAQGAVYQNAEGHIISANPAAERILGLTLAQMLGRTSMDPRWKAIHEDGSDFAGDTHPSMIALKTGKEVQHVAMGVFHPAANEYVWININAVPQFRPGQMKPCQVYTTFDDITKRKRAEEALRQSEENFKALAESASDGILIATGEEGRHVYANRRAVEITGYPVEDLLKTRMRDLAHPDELPKIAERYNKRLEGLEVPKPYETAILNKDGVKVPLEISPSRTTWQNQLADMTIFRDITERKQREEEQAYETRLHKFRSEMAYSVNRQLSLREILQQSAEVIMRNFDIAFAQIWTMNRGTNSLELRAHGELSTPCTESDECIHMGNLLASWVVAGRQTIASNSILDRPLLIDASWARHHNIVAYAGLPLFVEDRLVGVLTIYAGTLLLDRTLSALAVSAVTLAQGIMRKWAEDALRESEERHRSLVEAAPDVIYTISAEDGSLTSLNPAFETVTGWSRAEWIGRPFASLVHPDDLPLAEETFQRALRGEKQPPYELRVLSKSGECLVGEFTSTPHVKDGKVVGEFGIARDITERKKVEQVLQQERILLRTLIDNLPDAIYVKDMASRKTVANLADVHNTGRQSEAEVLGKDDFELFPKDLAERFFADDQSVIQTGRPILEREEYVLDAEGQKRWLLTSKLPLRDKEGQVVGLVGIGRDITERKRAEEALRQSEEKYRMLFDEAPVGIAISTLEGKIVDVNKAQAEMIGHTVEELTGRSVNEYYLYPDRRIEMIELLKSNGKVRDFEMTLRKSDGSIITELLNLDKVQIGIIHYVLATGRDITERKRAEEALRESEEKYRNVVERANDGIAIVQDTLVKYVNATLAEVAGCTIEELIGAPFADYIYPDDLGKVADRYKRRIAGEDVAPVYEIAVRHKDGSKVYVEVNAGMIMYQGKPAELVIVRDLTERKRAELASKRAEEALRYERNLLRTLIDNLPDAVYVKDTECRKTVANAADVRYMGQQSEAEVLGKTDFDFYPADAAAVYHADDQSVVQTGQPVLNKAEFLVDKEGKEHWFSTSKLPLHDEQGRIIGLVGVGRDITERKRAEEALRLEKENFRRSLDESPLGVRIVTADGDTLYANRAILDFYGYDGLEELRKTPLRARYTPESYTEFQKRRQQRERGDFSTSEYGISIIRKNGEVLHLEVHRKQVLWDNAKQFLVMYQDITERKKAEEEVALLGHTIRSIGECVSVTDTENKILFVNEAFLRTYGYTADELIGKPIAVIRSPRSESAAEKVLSTTLKGGWQGELVNRKKDGTEFPIALSTFVIRNEKGQPIALVGIAADITERKLAEQASKRVEERLKSSREQLRALAAHLHRVREEERKHLAQEFHDQLGQTLTALKMDLTMLQRQVADKEKELSRTAVSVDIQAMQQIADHAIGSIREIMAELRPELLDQLGIMPALEFEAESFQRKSGISCVFTSLVDEIQLDQEKSIALFRIFQEALTNVVRHAKATSVRANIRMEGTNLLLEIKDNGVGILPGAEDAKDSFGIIGMRERALVFGGAFEIRGAKGEGTTIVLRLPLEETLADRGDA